MAKQSLEPLHVAASLSDALAHARWLKAKKGYRYFRGQRDAVWPLSSTAARQGGLADEEIDATKAFVDWIAAYHRREDLAFTDEQLLATAQHYGFKTPFIDFTTEPEVAAYFAYAPPPADNADATHGRIFCLTPKHVRTIRKALERIRAQPPKTREEADRAFKLQTVAVSNLWRLEAQHGVFIECMADGIDRRAPVDYILFPHVEPANPLPESRFFPMQRSKLEIDIDVFLAGRRAQEGRRAVHEVSSVMEFKPAPVDTKTYEALGRPTRRLADVAALDPALHADQAAKIKSIRTGAEIRTPIPLQVLPDIEGLPAVRYAKGVLHPHPSWFTASALAWLEVAHEAWRDVPADRELVVRCKEGALADVEKDVAASVAGAPLAALRRSPLRLVLEAPWAGDQEHIDRVMRSAGHIWDSLRDAPISDRKLSELVQRYFVQRLALSVMDYGDFRRWRETVVGEAVRIELSAAGGQALIAEVNIDRSKAALRPDLNDVLEVTDRATIERRDHYIGQINLPYYIFDFDRFVALFCDDILPSMSDRYADLTSYSINPRKIVVMGPP